MNETVIKPASKIDREPTRAELTTEIDRLKKELSEKNKLIEEQAAVILKYQLASRTLRSWSPQQVARLR
jgi:hypothetical protein